ncbi:hypothetical protein ACQEU3_21160 [Spirillospora sp. CA-253888]
MTSSALARRPVPAPVRRAASAVAALPRRSAYAVAALPAALASLPGLRVQPLLARRLLGPDATRAARHRVALHALASLPLGLLSLVVAVYGWSFVLLNVLYPVRPLIGMGDGSYQDAWGGPTLAGAWAVHGAGGLVLLVVLAYLLKGVTALQERLMRWTMGV